jgi:hypothetical protein
MMIENMLLLFLRDSILFITNLHPNHVSGFVKKFNVLYVTLYLANWRICDAGHKNLNLKNHNV